jgi:hypothetical protein
MRGENGGRKPRGKQIPEGIRRMKGGNSNRDTEKKYQGHDIDTPRFAGYLTRQLSETPE